MAKSDSYEAWGGRGWLDFNPLEGFMGVANGKFHDRLGQFLPLCNL